ncbi:MAG: hypothetical protein FJ213_02725 [Ignavibacteria bacterium]|nr:hypothetical protein [Ignavibacteria bacterium]
MKNFSKLFSILLLFGLSFSFLGSDCSTGTDEPVTPTTVAPATGLTIAVDAVAGGNSFAIANWNQSADHSKSDFKGYIVSTYEVNLMGENISKFDSTLVLKTESRKRTINSIARGKKYKTYVYAVNNANKLSIPIGSIIFGGVYYNNDGIIDEFKDPSPAKSGYGWDPSTGVGTQYSFASANFSNIDLHMRTDGTVLTFYSPKQGDSRARDTKFSQVPGDKQFAFDLIEGLTEPNLAKISAVKDNVYLLKTQDEIYIKVWVKNIKTTGSGTSAYQTVEFDYKVQPVTNFRVVKK